MNLLKKIERSHPVKQSIFYGSCMAVLMFLLVGCGYQLGQGGLTAAYRTISVPYPEGDFDGSLTSSIVRRISRSGSFEYLSSGGELTLLVKMLDLNDENIGFRYDRHKEGELSRRIIPTETRITAVAEVSVVESVSGTVVLGPTRLLASVDFDHEYYDSHNEVNVFSLGQLTDVDEANDAVMRPLNEVLAEKIVDYISDSW